MIAPLVTAERSIVGIHRTWLAEDGGGKAAIVSGDGEILPAKKMKGQAWGACIPLAPRAEAMQGGEGIETALAGLDAVPDLPAVALGSLGNFAGGGLNAGRVAHPRRKRADGQPIWLPNPAPDPARPGWLPPPECKRFTWLADADAGDPESAAMLQVRGCIRYAQRGIEMRVATPPAGSDMNDLYRRQLSNPPEGCGLTQGERAERPAAPVAMAANVPADLSVVPA